MASYIFNKYCDAGRLEFEIKSSDISKAVEYIETVISPPKTTCVFKETISEQNQIDLAALITAHVATPLEDKQTTLVEVKTIAPYGNKQVTLANGLVKDLYARNTGIKYDLDIGDNVISYSIPYPQCKIIGMQAINCEALDTVDFQVIDSPSGAYSGVANKVLNQFAYKLVLPNGFYERYSKFDADIYYGMSLKITYNSVSAKTVGLNVIMDEVK